MDKLDLFADHALFRHLSRDEIAKLLVHARIERHPTNQIIFQKGSPGQSMMALMGGHVKVCSLSDEGKEIVFNIIKPGQVFGEVALLDGRERTADAVAMSDCELLVLDRRHFLPFLRDNPEIAIRLLGVLCDRIRRTTEQVEDVLFLDVPSRLAKTLLQLADDHGRPTPAGRLIDFKLSQHELGTLIGISRESINKQLRDWEKSGLLQIERGSIVLANESALSKVSARN